MDVAFDFDYWRDLFAADPEAFERERTRLNDALCTHWRGRCVDPARIDLVREAVDSEQLRKLPALEGVQELMLLAGEGLAALNVAFDHFTVARQIEKAAR